MSEKRQLFHEGCCSDTDSAIQIECVGSYREEALLELRTTDPFNTTSVYLTTHELQWLGAMLWRIGMED